MNLEGIPEYERLSWLVIHGRGVLHTGHASFFVKILATAGMVSGRESSYYMRYDDSPERDSIPMMFYAVMGNPSIDTILHEEVEPVGEIFDAIVVMDSSMLVHTTSQRALLFDGAKKDAVLVVNTSLSSDEVLGLVRKYSLRKSWTGKLVRIQARNYDKEIAYPLLGALLKAWKAVSVEDLLKALDSLGGSNKVDIVNRAYRDAKPVNVNEEMFVAERKETMRTEPSSKKWWDLETYRMRQKVASEASSYYERLHAMPRWEDLAPGLIEFGPSPGEKNLGFKTRFERYLRPIIDQAKCIDCKMCHLYCPDAAINFDPIEIDFDYCTGCGVCSEVCPLKAISMVSELEAEEGLKEKEISTIGEALREYGY